MVTQELQMMATPSGTRFGLLARPEARSMPTIIVIGNDIEYSLTSNEINEVGRLLGEKGFASFALDVPCHGSDARTGEPHGLDGWRTRLDHGENFVRPFTKNVSEVVDFLVGQGLSDPSRIAVAGTSRGGFLGLHAMAEETRIRCAAVFAPVTELHILEEFKGLESHSLTRSLGLDNIAHRLAGRPLWMCIGNNDERVGTDNLIAFSRRVVAASVTKKMPAPIELHVMQTEGHRIHASAHEEAARWLDVEMSRPSPCRS